MHSVKYLKEILTRTHSKKISVAEAFKALKNLPYQNMEFVRLDHHRAVRKGFGEVIYCENKTPEQIKKITEVLLRHKNPILLTRAAKSLYSYLKKYFPVLKYNEPGRVIYLKRGGLKNKKTVLILTAGTSDIPVAEEARITLEVMGNKVKAVYDVGVAGIHRLLDKLPEISKANVIIVVAGMEGALGSVIGGLTDKPVIAVPTSVGYGSSFKGIAPLLTMMNSCAPGVSVVNIDNGFGAGYFASLINK
ncbi:MAG: 1-(5-phosphoribosyl)-5-amino-4-imidazole-carboxylate carboxylase [Candidatus Omnitrophica bacterium CG_4_9_14_0_2_um_filter_42_8]|nr:MAG: 1-(5-phosphoribosyl)-5-amino-4-imidazole-carboxylate carboxylase [Candidatus Omnitrophica bacterium CG22_combo_CG10-13_8_21_14_all_43_16]PJC47808.1 MAG: 1-(5-phosphoribosyl)-5-amino-4-imidazole-carboxylate carboxylase [Candidatus Omnitrophica bacterium CG_4_9_14_0_2_um_filter_42_8]